MAADTNRGAPPPFSPVIWHLSSVFSLANQKMKWMKKKGDRVVTGHRAAAEINVVY